MVFPPFCAEQVRMFVHNRERSPFIGSAEADRIADLNTLGPQPNDQFTALLEDVHMGWPMLPGPVGKS
jgi:hypothetical protein